MMSFDAVQRKMQQITDFEREVNFCLTLLFTTAEETDCGCMDLEGVIPPAGSGATG